MASLAVSEARRALDALAKPPGSLGRLEDWAARLRVLGCTAARSGGEVEAWLVIFAGDHGALAACPELSAYPRSVTVSMCQGIAAGASASAALARANGCGLTLVDVGVDGEPRSETVVDRKIARGTADMSTGPAMTTEELDRALEVGRAFADAQKCDVLLVGELGLGNTTSAAALLVAYAEVDPDEATGVGTGLDEPRRKAKADFVRRSVDRARRDATGARDLLRHLGGLEIAAMTGAYLAAAAQRRPVLVDGFVAAAAALAAVRIEPAAADVLFLSHTSAERGGKHLVAALERAGAAPPLLDLGLRLGEGTGALAALGLFRSAAAIWSIATLAEISGADQGDDDDA